MSITDERLREAKQLLKESEELLLKYPESFALKFTVRQWKEHIKELENQKSLVV